MMTPKLYLVAVFMLVFQACAMSPESASLVSSPGFVAKPVLQKGMKLTVNSELGKMEIMAAGYTERVFSWDDNPARANLAAGEKKYSCDFGFYSPVRGKSVKSHDREVRVNLEEAVMSYHTLNEPIDYIWSQKFEQPGFDVETIYTDDGLVVQISKYIRRDRPESTPLNISIWQIYVMGEKPTKLPGSRNEKISLSFSGK